MSWNDKRVSTLRKLWAEGHSASQIAKLLGGVTRNAVIGKVHRLGLTGRTTPSRPVKVPRRNFIGKKQATLLSDVSPMDKSKIAQLPVMMVEHPVVHGNALVAVKTLLPEQCRWPVGDPLVVGFSFCPSQQYGSHPYCFDHLVTSVHPARQQAYRERLLQSVSVRAA